MPNPQIDIVKSVVHRLPLGSGVHTDRQLPGFFVLCNRRTRSYVFQGELDGRTVRVTLGHVEDITAEAARLEALKARELIRQDRNPNVERRIEEAKGMSLAEAFDLLKKSESRSPKTTELYEAIFRNHLQPWASRTMLQIGHDRPGVRKLHEEITAHVKAEIEKQHAERVARMAKHRKPYRRPVKDVPEQAGWSTANNALRLLKGIYNRSRLEVPALPEDPTVNVNWHRDVVRQNSLSVEELKGWYEKVQKLGNPVKRAYWLAVILTGARRNSVAEARWTDIDVDRGLWHFPNPKDGPERRFTVPLSRYLIERLRNLKKADEILHPGSEWAFPSSVSKSGHLTIPRNDKQGLPLSHTLRHTYRTHSLLAGVSDVHSHLLMNHRMAGVNYDYISRQVTVEELRAAQERVTEHFLRHFGVTQPEPPKAKPEPEKPATLFDLELKRKLTMRHRARMSR